MNHRITLLAGLSVAAIVAEAKVELGSPFSEGMVLQRQMDVPVWGWATPGNEVKVSFADAEVSANVGSDGRWSVKLPPMEASHESRIMTVEETEPGWFGSTVDRIEVGDVLVGEVWFVSGQSNCEFPLVGQNAHISDEDGGMTAQLTRRDEVRFLYASDYKTVTKPQARTSSPVVWKRFAPKNLREPRGFSAIGVYFGLELHDALHIPIGLVGVYWGATCIEPWIPTSGFRSIPEFRAESEWRIKDAETFTKTGGLKPLVPDIDDYHNKVQQQPAAIWNRQVAPLAPYAMRGLVWYQGCSNKRSPGRYAQMMHALYNGWSKEFANPAMKLYFAQLAPFSDEWPALWEAQAKFEREEPNAAMAVINDVGMTSDIHPNRKRPVARRLAVHALKRDYGFSDLVDNSPTLKSWRRDGNRIVLSFNDVEKWFVYNADWSIWTGFEVAGADGKFYPARIENMDGGATKTIPWRTRGVIDGKDLVIIADEVKDPKTLRYLYSRPWKGCLFNEVNLPLGAFRVDVSK